MKKRIEKDIKKKSKILLFGVLLSLLLIFISINLYNSVIFKRHDRINLLIFEQNPVFLSLSTIGEANYILYLYPDLKLNIPGGFGYYRVGALSKLATLEKNPEIFNRAISGSTHLFLDFYFYPKKIEIYYGTGNKPQTIELSIRNILFDKSNANFFDKLYLAYKTLTLNKKDLNKLKSFEVLNKNKDTVFDTKRFEDSYNG